jgi:hypothetical protein
MEKLKIVQMDLGRQKETLLEICHFFDFAKKYGYNAIALNLEDRIKTKTYPYASDEESYLPEEVSAIVEAARERELELIPVISNFAHADRFLSHDELAHISETRDGQGFHNTTIRLTACPLLPASQQFYDAYFAEVAALFKYSKYFHAGLDEDFDIGSCSLCKADVEAHGGIGHLFLSHIKRTNAVLNALGKEMMIWDDMLVYCPEIIPEIPKNVILCTWCYDYVDLYPRAPMANSRQTDIFALYEKNGLRYMPAVWCNFTHNVDTFTKYADNYHPMGYYNTVWGMSSEQLLFVYPLIAYTGMLWSGRYKDDPAERMRAAVREVIGAEDPMDIAVLCRAVDKPYLNRGMIYLVGDHIVRRNPNFEDEYKEVCLLCELFGLLKTENDFVRAIRFRVERAKLLYEALTEDERLIDYRGGLYDADPGESEKRLLAIRAQILSQYEEQCALWERYRGGIPREYLDGEHKGVLSAIDRLLKEAREARFGDRGLLFLQMLLPEKTVWINVKVTVEYEDGTEERFAPHMYKPLAGPCYNIMDKGPYFYIDTRKIAAKKPKRITVSLHGAGSACIEYIFCQSGGKKYLPEKVTPFGPAHWGSEHLLTHDTRFAVIGNPDMALAMSDASVRKSESGVVIDLRAED